MHRLLICSLLGVSVGQVAMAADPGIATTPPTPHLSAQVSWVGNTWAGKPAWMSQNIDDLFVATDGTILTNVAWEEAGGNVMSLTSAGTWVGAAMHTHGWGHQGGQAVSANATYAFLGVQMGNEGGGLKDATTWPPKGSTWLGVSRRLRADFSKGAPFPDGKGGAGDSLRGSYLVVVESVDSGPMEMLRGLVATDTELFVSLRNAGVVRVFDAEKMTLTRTLPLARADRLAVAPNNRLWALQAPAGEEAWHIVGLDATTGAQVADFTCAKPWLPSDLALGPDGRLYVTDTGPDQQIKVLDGLASGTLRLAEAIGVKGGVFAGPGSGALGNLRFHRPQGVGLDAAGNLYVANDGGGTTLESYTPTRELRWRRHGLQFVDLPDLDAVGKTVYTFEEIYDLDLTKPAGQQWTPRAFTSNPGLFPDDPRAHAGCSNAWYRELGGKPFLFVTGMSAPFLSVFRFDPAQAGALAIPCAHFSRLPRGTEWPAAAPKDGGFRWQDGNADGAMQADEFAANDRDGNNVQGMFPITPDLSGRLWWGFGDEIRAYAFTGLTAAGLTAGGLPQWDWAKPFIFPRPAEFDEVRRVGYDVPNDVMVLGGGKGEAKHQHWKPMGPVISAYEHVLRGTPSKRWTVTLPFDSGASGHMSNEPMGFDLAGDFLFVAYTHGLQVDGLNNAFVKVLRLSDGSVVGNLVSDDVTGEIGLLDIEQAVNARRLLDGRYTVLLEDDYKGKSVLFVWKP